MISWRLEGGTVKRSGNDMFAVVWSFELERTSSVRYFDLWDRLTVEMRGDGR